MINMNESDIIRTEWLKLKFLGLKIYLYLIQVQIQLKLNRKSEIKSYSIQLSWLHTR